MENISATFIISKKQSEQLRDLAYMITKATKRRKTQSDLVREALELLFKTIPGKKDKNGKSNRSSR